MEKKSDVYASVWEQGRLEEIDNQSCNYGLSQHQWNQVAFKVDDGVISYCQFCLIERAKIFDRAVKGLVSKYYPHGTWFKIVSPKAK